MIEVKRNMMDRMVAAFSPERGLKRMAARASLAAATAMTAPRGGAPTDPAGRLWGRGGYKGAHSDRRQTRGWFARARSANADVLGDQKTMVARGRDATMNMPLATAAVERPITFAVGSGLMAIPDFDAERLGIADDEAQKLASQVSADYDEYMSSTDPDAERSATGYGLQDVILRSVLEAGDVLQVRVMPQNQVGRSHETAWKLYEADRILSPFGHNEGERIAQGQDGAGNVCAGGVEVDDFGAPIAFHVLKQPPQAFGFTTMQGRLAGDTIRILAWGDNSKLPTAQLIMQKRRAEQFRGVSILAPVMEVLRQVSDLTEAELFAAVLQAMIAIVYKSPGAQAMPEPQYGEGTREPAQAGLDVPTNPMANYRLEAGTILEIDSEAGATPWATSRPNNAFDPFFMTLAKQIAAAIEVPLEILLLAFTASYSASRGALEVFYIRVRKWREWLASHAETPRYQAWLYEQVAKGAYPQMKGFLANDRLRGLWSRVRFRGDGKISLDPARESIGYEKREAHAWQTGAEITAELTGGDYDANVRRRVGEFKRFVDGGLPIPNAVGGGATPPPLNEPSGASRADNPEKV